MTSLLTLTLLASISARNADAQTSVPAPGPVQYRAVQQANLQAIEMQKRQEQDDQEAKQKQQQMMQQLTGLLQSATGGGGKGGGKGRGNASADAGAASASSAGESNGIGTSKLEPCGTPPAQVQSDFQQMMEFRKSCGAADKGSQQKFAINEYRSSLGTPTMYLYDETGTCKYKTSVSFGSGKVRGPATGAPQACAGNGDHFTPAGMHLTVRHPRVSKYDDSNSLGLAGLEEQGSNARGILIHGSNSPGEGYSYGCSGVGCIPDVMKFLGYGALVFNSFDDSQSAPGCKNTAGMKRTGSCRAEAQAQVSDANPGNIDGAGAAR